MPNDAAVSTVTMTAYQTEATVQVIIDDDTKREDTEDLIVTLGALSSATADPFLGADYTFTISIEDNEGKHE